MGATTSVSLEEYLALPLSDGGSEYDEGRVVELPAPTLRDAEIQSEVIYSLGAFVRTAGLDHIIAGPTGYWLTPNVERIPSLIRRTKVAALEVFHGSLCGAPDVLSRSSLPANPP